MSNHSEQKSANTQAHWGQLHGSSMALYLANGAQEHCGLSVLITKDAVSAQQMLQALAFYKQPSLPLLHFPDWETLPYDMFSPHQDIISERIRGLYDIPNTQQGILVLPITTLMQRIAPRSFIQQQSFVLQVRDIFNPQVQRQILAGLGYRHVSQVMEHGEYSLRGSIFDIFPMGYHSPLRIDLLDDEVDSIRTFDPETQRSQEKIPSIELLPAREFPLHEEAITLFRNQWRDHFAGNPLECPMYEDVSQSICPGGIEYYSPLFFQETASLLDYFPDNTHLFLMQEAHEQATHYMTDIKERYEQRKHDVTRPLLAPNQLFFDVEALFAGFKSFLQTQLHQHKHPKGKNFSTLALPDIAVDQRKPLNKLQSFIQNNTYRLLFCAESQGRREVLREMLKEINLHPKDIEHWHDFLGQDNGPGITVAPLTSGLLLDNDNILLITEAELFGQQTITHRQRQATKIDPDAIIRNLAELTTGNPVVHIEHGVGRYQGLITLHVNDREEEFLHLQYADSAKLYVPVSSLHMINRYSGADADHAPLHRLGSDQWSKVKRKAQEKVRDAAAELLDIYARRAAREGHAFQKPDSQYYSFAAQFPFEETVDQEQAIEQVMQDMMSDNPMDRLICGDVGFGKTEVAIRASFLCVQGGKQVGILVPTTLLAQQHYDTFCDRFAHWPVNIELLSRFRTKKEQAEAIEQLGQGKVDIIIGTHALIQPQVQFKQLGLLIIDEEHRFGVRQKEKLKALRSEVDILALTATPIPRTLNMAMSGLRELSIIATPPAKRLSIKTFIHQHNNAIIQEAISRELLRGGQVYYLHNKVETIHATAEKLRELLPEARIVVAHGQMHERELEKVMSDFYHQRHNVLVCTTIIETGIDIPTANTIVIDRADRFGLAQLHQLRGRVGRSHHQAYAYLITPPPKAMTKDAQKRLDAITSLEDLGIGFTLATHDLEIRGAGEYLGEEQSGNMQAIGFSLYMELLEEAVKAMREGRQPELDKPLNHGTEVDLKVSALIPEDYLPDVHTRLVLYKRIANANSPEALKELQVEMVDRFGLLPQQVKHLFANAGLKVTAQPIGINKIEAGPQGGKIDFESEAKVDPVKLIKLIQLHPKIYQFDGAQRLRFTRELEDYGDRIAFVHQLLKEIALT